MSRDILLEYVDTYGSDCKQCPSKGGGAGTEVGQTLFEDGDNTVDREGFKFWFLSHNLCQSIFDYRSNVIN